MDYCQPPWWERELAQWEVRACALQGQLLVWCAPLWSLWSLHYFCHITCTWHYQSLHVEHILRYYGRVLLVCDSCLILTGVFFYRTEGQRISFSLLFQMYWRCFFYVFRFYIESISYLKDNATIELFFLNAKSIIYKVNSLFCRHYVQSVYCWLVIMEGCVHSEGFTTMGRRNTL